MSRKNKKSSQTTRRGAFPHHPPAWLTRGPVRFVCGVTLIGLVGILVAATLTYADPGFLGEAPQRHVWFLNLPANLCGPWGRALATPFVWGLGWGAYPAYVLLIWWAIKLFSGGEGRAALWRLAGAAVFLPSFAALLFMLRPGHVTETMMVGIGGAAGEVLGRFLLRRFHTFGAVVMGGTLALLSFPIATEFTVVSGAWRQLRRLGGWMRGLRPPRLKGLRDSLKIPDEILGPDLAALDAQRADRERERRLSAEGGHAPSDALEVSAVGAAGAKAAVEVGGLEGEEGVTSGGESRGAPQEAVGLLALLGIGRKGKRAGRTEARPLAAPAAARAGAGPVGVRAADAQEAAGEAGAGQTALPAEAPGPGEDGGGEESSTGTTRKKRIPRITLPGIKRNEKRETEGGDGEEAGGQEPSEDLDLPDPVGRGGAPRGKGRRGAYVLPPLTLLDEPERIPAREQERAIREQASVLEATLRSFKIEAEVVAIRRGPAVTFFEVGLAAGTKVGKVIGLEEDLAIGLKTSSVRVVSPIPGKSTIGIEVPNSMREVVLLRDLIRQETIRNRRISIPLFLGKNLSGTPFLQDLAAMPHLLIAGSTGSGKSVCINAVILSILMSRSPEEVRVILVDPKMVELSQFKQIPHLLCPVVTDMRRVPAILEWAVNKMEERYLLLAEVGVRNILGYNKLGEEELRRRVGDEPVDGEEVPLELPFIVLVVDELADLMMVARKDVENSIVRLAQKSRAVGIHLILATQRPSIDVITGLIKANMPSRISFKVASKIDSRVVLDGNGAEKLLGQGDMLVLPPKSSDLVRCQGTYVGEEEVRRVCDFVKRGATPQFSTELLRPKGDGASGADRDPLYDQAVRVILETQRGSVSMLQRHLEIGFTRASRLIDLMTKDGIVGEYKGSKAREVLITADEWDQRLAAHRSGVATPDAPAEAAFEPSDPLEAPEAPETEDEEN